MNYYLIRSDDMLNGSGLRVVIFLSGCSHHCKGCHNSETWDENSGSKFTDKELSMIVNELGKTYISGITFSGGDPLHKSNIAAVYNLIQFLRAKFPSKTIWLYTGYEWEEIFYDTCELRKQILSLCDVVCDGKFIESLADVNYPWVGSTNQRVIDVKETLERNKVVELKEMK